MQLTQTVNFTETNDFPGISEALVTITDRTSNTTDTLSERNAGIYVTRTIEGISGHCYDLGVSYEGHTYMASTTMPFPVALDSVIFMHESDFGGNSINLAPYFQDPAGVANYYTFNKFVNNRKVSTSVFSDRLSDGKYIREELFGGGDAIEAGDTVLLKMNCVDKPVWNYFNTLVGAGLGAPAPSNPTSNISSNALGYFSAHTVQTVTDVAK